MVIWITGLSGSGKTTLANEVVRQLRQTRDDVVLLDGDQIRAVLGERFVDSSKTYEREQRLEIAFLYARLCKVLSEQGLIVVIATISLYKELHVWNRANIRHYKEVYLDVEIDELRNRDPKQLYQRFDNGEITNVAGLDVPVDRPEHSDIVFSIPPDRTVEEMAKRVINMFFEGSS